PAGRLPVRKPLTVFVLKAELRRNRSGPRRAVYGSQLVGDFPAGSCVIRIFPHYGQRESVPCYRKILAGGRGINLVEKQLVICREVCNLAVETAADRCMPIVEELLARCPPRQIIDISWWRILEHESSLLFIVETRRIRVSQIVYHPLLDKIHAAPQ